MADQFKDTADHVTAPATRATAVTPHDTNALSDIPKALFIGTGGTIVLRAVNSGTDTVWKNLANASVLPIRASHVRATGTTAADIVAMA